MIRLLVEERSSCLDVHLKVPLKNHGPTVHLEGYWKASSPTGNVIIRGVGQVP